MNNKEVQEKYQKLLDKLTAIMTPMNDVAMAQSKFRCPYRNKDDRCTAKFGCRNQRKPKENDLFGNKVILRNPKKDNWKEWAELRQRSRNFLQPWEPKWPSNFLTKESFASFINMFEMSLKKKTSYNFFIFHKKINNLMGGISLTNFK